MSSSRTRSTAGRSTARYGQRFAGENNFEGRNPAQLLRGKLPELVQFADDVSPEQQAFIEQYHASLNVIAA